MHINIIEDGIDEYWLISNVNILRKLQVQPHYKTHSLYVYMNVYMLFIALQMLLNLHKKTWMDGLTLQDYSDHCSLNENKVKVVYPALLYTLVNTHAVYQRKEHSSGVSSEYLWEKIKLFPLKSKGTSFSVFHSLIQHI